MYDKSTVCMSTACKAGMNTRRSRLLVQPFQDLCRTLFSVPSVYIESARDAGLAGLLPGNQTVLECDKRGTSSGQVELLFQRRPKVRLAGFWSSRAYRKRNAKWDIHPA